MADKTLSQRIDEVEEAAKTDPDLRYYLDGWPQAFRAGVRAAIEATDRG